jgi:hypothetical protein
MPETVNWTVSVQVPAGPRVVQAGSLKVDAYDKLMISLEDGDIDREVQIQPGGPGQVRLLVITTDRPSDDLAYKVNRDDADPISLDQPVHAFFGTGPVALLDAAAGPTSLFFTNATGETAAVQILVGRMATP